MSHPTVIGIFEAQLSAIGAALPYVDLLNIRPTELPDEFVALERDFSSTDRVTIGSPAMYRELGVLTLVVHVRAGTGAGDAQALSLLAADSFYNLAIQHFQVLSVGSGAVLDPDDGSYFQLKVPVQYQFDFFK